MMIYSYLKIRLKTMMMMVMTMVVVVVTVMIMQWSLTSLLAGVFSTRVITSSTTVMKPAQSVGTSLRGLIIQDSN